MKELTTLNREIIEVNSPLEITSVELVERFISFLDVSENTLKSYRAGIKIFMCYLSSKGITAPSRLDVITFKKILQEAGKSPATIALYLSAVKRFFDWLESEGLYENITRGIKAPKQDKGHKRDFLNGSQLSAVMQGVKREGLEGKRNYAILALMSTCGLRTVEVKRANVEDVRMLGGATVLYVQGKGRKDRKEFVKLTAPVIEAIRDYLKARGQVSKSAPLFASCSKRNFGQRLTTRTISGICKNSMRRAGFDSPLLTAHSLRHSAVTIALLAGETLAEVQYFARHSSINTTQIYAHNVDRLKSTCEAAITKAIFFHEVKARKFFNNRKERV